MQILGILLRCVCHLSPFHFVRYGRVSWLNVLGISQIAECILMTTEHKLDERGSEGKILARLCLWCDLLYHEGEKRGPHREHGTSAEQFPQKTSHSLPQIECLLQLKHSIMIQL